MADVIKFRTAKKAVTRKRKDQAAAENRVKFGRTKAEKARDAGGKADRARRIDSHRLNDDPKPDDT